VTLEQQSRPTRWMRGIRSLNKLSQGIFRITVMYTDGLPIEPKGVNSKWRGDCGVLARENCKITWAHLDDVSESDKNALSELIKVHYAFPPDFNEHGKRATLITIGRDLQCFRHQLNKYYIQSSVSPLIRFGFITPNKWNTFQ
jgi:hypothetical protein